MKTSRIVSLIVVGLACSFVAAQEMTKPQGGDHAWSGQMPKMAPDKPVLRGKKSYATIKPLFDRKCGCHGGDRPRGRFSIASLATILQPSKSGLMIKPGDPKHSPLLEYLRGARQPQMPIRSAPLAPKDINFISDWIKKGAK
jgi:hypothetical protein